MNRAFRVIVCFLPLALACVRGAGERGGPGAGDDDFLEGSTPYDGPFADPVDVTYTLDGRTETVNAVPGQVLVFFGEPVSAAEAEPIFTLAGGTIVSKYPGAGYYLVAVTPGSEGAFITAMTADPRNPQALPHVVGALATDAAILDGCDLAHGQTVEGIIGSYGGTFDECRDIANATGDVFVHQVAQGILTEAGENGTDHPTLINLSASGGPNGVDWTTLTPEDQAQSQWWWLRFMRITVASICAVPAAQRENMVVTVAAGNANVDVGAQIAEMRNDPRIAQCLDENVVIVGTNLMTAPPGNHADGDDDFLRYDNSEASGGTSYAAPAVMALVQRIVAQTGLSPKDALRAVKIAGRTNANHTLVDAEAFDKANAIADAQNTDGPGSESVTAIAFASVGATTAGQITPAIENVTVQYTVSGTDGYYDSGTLQTDAAGQASFGIPPGGSGVTDTISVSAVLSGRTATTQYTW